MIFQTDIKYGYIALENILKSGIYQAQKRFKDFKSTKLGKNQRFKDILPVVFALWSTNYIMQRDKILISIA